MAELDANNASPLYKQLKEDLKNKLRNSIYLPGEKLPSENDLSRIYSVSRITVRNALAELSQEGLVVQKRGKGTFATDKKIARQINQLMSFSEVCQLNGVKPRAKVIRSVFDKPNANDIEMLGLYEGDKIIAIDRIRFADDIPVSLEQSHFPEKYSFLLREDLNDISMYSLLKKKYNITLNSSKSQVEIAFATFEQAQYLGVSEKYPLLCIRSCPVDTEQNPVHTSQNFIISEKFKFWI